jgi:hypothetical protein
MLKSNCGGDIMKITKEQEQKICELYVSKFNGVKKTTKEEHAFLDGMVETLKILDIKIKGISE